MRITPDILIRSGRCVTHLTFCAFILILPVGFYPSDSGQSEMTIGVHGGVGQVASVIRDCSGDAISSSTNSFNEIAASAEVTTPIGNQSFVQFGVRSGHWRVSNPRLVVSPYVVDNGVTDFSETYMNPHLSLEGKKIGIGLGYFSGNVPWSLSDDNAFENAFDQMLTGHLRIGKLNSPHFLAQLGENIPLTTAGLFTMGYGMGGNNYYYVAFSAGFYDRPGFYCLTRWSLTERTILDLSGRIGGAAGHFEGGIATGINYRFDMGKK